MERWTHEKKVLLSWKPIHIIPHDKNTVKSRLVERVIGGARLILCPLRRCGIHWDVPGGPSSWETGAQKIYLVGYQGTREDRWPAPLRIAATTVQCTIHPGGCASALVSDGLPVRCDLIFNLAAVASRAGSCAS